MKRVIIFRATNDVLRIRIVSIIRAVAISYYRGLKIHEISPSSALATDHGFVARVDMCAESRRNLAMDNATLPGFGVS